MRRVNADFIPVALRATLVNGVDNSGDRNERLLYQRIRRVMPAPQGICVLNSAGQVLDCVLTFDDDRSVLAFLDQSLDRFRDDPGAARPVIAGRYMRFPGGVLEALPAEGEPTAISGTHANGVACPALACSKSSAGPGAVPARLVGRALGADGEPHPDTVRQEHYAEDQFSVSPSLQRELARALRAGETEGSTIRLPGEFARLCASHAYLGHIDSGPLLEMGNGVRNRGKWKRCVFRARKMADRSEPGARWRIEGESEVVSELAVNGVGVHDVKLIWEGYVDMDGQRMTGLLLAARGRERLRFAADDHPLKRGQLDEVAVLPAGRPVDLDCDVRYGVIGESGGNAIPAPKEAVDE